MRGGKRAGAGRPKGSRNERSREIADKAFGEGMTPLEYMLMVMRDEAEDPARRADMAKAAAPYMHPRLQAIEHTGPGGGPVQARVQVVFVASSAPAGV